jgi:hypothetical protein
VTLGTGVAASVVTLTRMRRFLVSEKMVADVEPFRPLGIVDAGNLHQLLIFEAGCVTQRAAGLNDALAPHRQRDLADLALRLDQRVSDRRLGRVDNAFIRSHLRDVGGELGGHQRSIVPSRRIFRCSCRIP